MTTPTPSTLLAALIAASTATNGVITVGDTQPFDQVRLYQNPANGTRLSNQSSDGAIDTSTTALVITGSTAPTGLVFEPNLSVLRNVTSDIKLLVDTPVELTLTINLAGTLTEMTALSGKTAVLTLGLIAGIPMIVGSHGFFELATDGNSAVGGLLLVPTGAMESADGEFQRFESIIPNDSSWIAQLATEDWRPALGVEFKVPLVTSTDQSFSIFFHNGEFPFGGSGLYLGCQLSPSHIFFGIIGLAQESWVAHYQPTPSADTVVTLTIASDSISIAYNAVSETLDISTHNITGPFNCAPSIVGFEGTAVLPLSIKVSALDQA